MSRQLVAEAFSNAGKKHQMRFQQSLVVSASKKIEAELSKDIGTNVLGQPPYKIAGLDLSALWIDLVKRNKVSASMNLPSTKSKDGDANDAAESSTVEYGIRLVEKATETADETTWAFEEYVQQTGLEKAGVLPDPLIFNINATLARSHQRSSGSGVEFKQVGNFVAQLQLVRTLRPPPSAGFQQATTSVPPPYNPETDSFVTGPLRLELRPLVGRLSVSMNSGDGNSEDETKDLLTTPWDVFHNISPADRRGHFLLLPSLLNEEMNWRGQSLTKEDCHDLVHLTGEIEPVGSMFIGYNSVGAGASQNHIHCHSWPYPNIGYAESDGDEEGEVDTFRYAVDSVGAIYDFCDIDGGKVEVSYLNYPVFCVQMSSSISNLDLLGRTLAVCLEAVGEAPHNIGFVNRFCEIEEDEEKDDDESNTVDNSTTEKMVDVFLFARSKERSSILPTLKLGISEMMGIFHAQSESELDALTTFEMVTNDEGERCKQSAMEKALADVSYEDDEELWNNMVARIEALEKES